MIETQRPFTVILNILVITGKASQGQFIYTAQLIHKDSSMCKNKSKA